MFLLSSDYDMTLNPYVDNLKINLGLLSSFRKNGNIFLLNTGRAFHSIKREIDEHKIDYDYLSCNDGNIMFNQKGEVLYSSNLDINLYDRLMELKKYYQLELKKVKFLENLLEFELIIKEINEDFLALLDKIMIECSLCYQVFKERGFFHFYIYDNRVNKTTPIEFLKKNYKFLHDYIYTTGDHYNDLEMIKNYHGYAMPWAKDEVKLVAEGVEEVSSVIKKINRKW